MRILLAIDVDATSAIPTLLVEPDRRSEATCYPVDGNLDEARRTAEVLNRVIAFSESLRDLS